MNRRVTTKCVIFTRPFVIDPLDGELPPGIYTVETEEEALEPVWFAAYRRVSTIVHVHALGITRFITVDPDVLAAALMRDARAAD